MKKASYYRRFTGLLPKDLIGKINEIDKARKFLVKTTKHTCIIIGEKRLFFKKINTPFKQHLLLMLVIFSIFLVFVLDRIQVLNYEVKKARVEAQEKVTYWDSVTKEHPDFPDAYYQAAWYDYILGEKQKAYEFLNKALSLDPGFNKAQELKEKMLRND